MTEPMKTAENPRLELAIADAMRENIESTRIMDHVEPVKRVVEEYAAQQVAAYRERIKMYMKGRLDKCKSEIKDTSVDSCARRLLQGHKYELSHLLKELDSL